MADEQQRPESNMKIGMIGFVVSLIFLFSVMGFSYWLGLP